MLFWKDTDRLSKFSIYNEETQQAVNHILEEFDDDAELVSKIKELEEDKNKKEIAEANSQTKKQDTEDEILNRMK